MLKIYSTGKTSPPLADLQSINSFPIPDPTILHIKPVHLTALASAIIEESKKTNYFLHQFAWRHKMAGILEGFITKESLWDRLIFNNARVQVMGKGAGTVRGVVVSGGQSSSLFHRVDIFNHSL